MRAPRKRRTTPVESLATSIGKSALMTLLHAGHRYHQLTPVNRSLVSSTRPSESKQNHSFKYNGVAFDKMNKKYMASITCHGKSQYLGRFQLAADAAWIHDECAKKSGGGNINFSSKAEYEVAREQEAAESSLDASSIDVSSLFTERVKKFQSALGNIMDCNTHTQAHLHNGIENEHNGHGISSPAMIFQELSSLTSPQSVASGTVKTEEISNPIISPNRSKLILLNSDQTGNLRFPSGTAVWWNEGNISGTESYRKGTVGGVFFDCTSRDLLYEVKHKGEPIFFLENDLGFAPPCPLFISSGIGGSGGDMLNGNALLCKRVGGDWVYTVSVEDQDGSIKLLENIPSNYVSLRKIA
jgi:hypothetical protein